MKTSVTLEPYQTLQLDIGAAGIQNIVDALRSLTQPETLHGQFNSSRGATSTATKQVTIEQLPSVLILHLKRFQYDNTGGTQKIWKKVGYPLELEVPKEVFAQHRRSGLTAQGVMPRYKLVGVVYHHGKNASGGHYTVDVQRQDGREWVRLDDTAIQRIRRNDVAREGGEDNAKSEASREGPGSPNLAASETEPAWASANGHIATPTPVYNRPSSIKDNKVAYILFYERI